MGPSTLLPAAGNQDSPDTCTECNSVLHARSPCAIASEMTLSDSAGGSSFAQPTGTGCAVSIRPLSTVTAGATLFASNGGEVSTTVSPFYSRLGSPGCGGGGGVSHVSPNYRPISPRFAIDEATAAASATASPSSDSWPPLPPGSNTELTVGNVIGIAGGMVFGFGVISLLGYFIFRGRPDKTRAKDSGDAGESTAADPISRPELGETARSELKGAALLPEAAVEFRHELDAAVALPELLAEEVAKEKPSDPA